MFKITKARVLSALVVGLSFAWAVSIYFLHTMEQESRARTKEHWALADKYNEASANVQRLLHERTTLKAQIAELHGTVGDRDGKITQLELKLDKWLDQVVLLHGVIDDLEAKAKTPLPKYREIKLPTAARE